MTNLIPEITVKKNRLILYLPTSLSLADKHLNLILKNNVSS